MPALQSSHLTRHAESSAHKAAAAAAIGNDDPLVGAVPPSADEFMHLMERISEGAATCSSRKQAKMTWCVCEAMKARGQAFIAKAKAVVFFGTSAMVVSRFDFGQRRATYKFMPARWDRKENLELVAIT